MNKRKFLRILFIISFVWIFLLMVFYFITSNYRNIAINYLKEYLDKQLTTEIVVRKDQIHFSVFKNFPHISIWMNNILIKSSPGPNYKQIAFQSKDTLLYAEEVSFIFNIKSLFTNNYDLRKIVIRNADLNILFDKELNSNYQIFRKSNINTDSFDLDLKKIYLENIHFNYINASQVTYLKSNIKEASFSGKISKNHLKFRMDISGTETNLSYNSTHYLKNESIQVKVDFTNNQDIILLNKGVLSIFGANFNFTGNWNKQNNSYKLLVQMNESSLLKIRSEYFETIYKKIGFYPRKGSFSATMVILGKNKKNPLINIDYSLSKAVFKNNEDITIDNITMKGSYTNGKEANQVSSVIKIDSLILKSDKSQISGKLKISNLSNPDIMGILRGNIELAKIAKIKGLQKKFNFDGIINTQIEFKGVIPSVYPFKISYIKYLNFHSKIFFNDIKVEPLNNSFPVSYVSGQITFNNLNEINLEEISVKTGNSVLIVDGNISNIPILNDKDHGVFLTYNCNVKSPEFHVEDFLIKDSENHKKNLEFKADFPDSIIIKAAFKTDNLYFGKFSASNVKGLINYFPKTLTIKDFRMNSQNGEISSEIFINQNDNLFITHCNATLDKINIRSLFGALNDFGQDVIKSENLGGNLSGHVNVIETWDQHLNPQKENLNLQADYEISDGEIVNYQPLMGLSKFIEVEELKHIRFQKLQSNISISNNTVFFSQTDIRSSATNLTGSGEHHFDNSYEYHFQVLLSDILWNKAKRKKPQNSEFGYVVDDELNRTVIPIVIKGKGTVYEVSYDRKTAAKNFKEKLIKEKEELKGLFNSDISDQPKENFQEEERINWNENKENTNSIRNSESENKDTNKENQDDFSIQWDDN